MTCTLKNETSSFTCDYVDVEETPTWNANIATTIGGVVKTQADTQRLTLKTTWYIYQSDAKSFFDILTAFEKELTFTPDRILLYKDTIADIVVVAGTPEVERYMYDNELVYKVTLTLEEVIA